MRSGTEKAADLLSNGQLTSAHFAIRRILRRDPDNVEALILNVELQLRRGRRLEALDLIESLVRRSPAEISDQQALRLGGLCFDNENYKQAIDSFGRAGQNVDSDSLRLYQYGVALRRLGRTTAAEERLLLSIANAPTVAAPYLQLGHLCKALGRVNDASIYYKQFIDKADREKGTGYWCLADLKSYDFSPDELAAMRDEVETQAGNPLQQSSLYFALGWSAEKNKDYAGAMDLYNKGNAIQARLKPFNAPQYQRIVEGLRQVPAGTDMQSGASGPTPILIVGLPRSGTTLVEQILSSHSRVSATDELPFLETIALRLELDGGYVSQLVDFSAEQRQALQQEYRDGAAAYHGNGCDLFVDKYPGNFLHIGLAKRLDPKTRVIDIRRDPRDIAVSAYRQLFNVRNEFASSLDGIYEYYKGYRAMIDHWQSVYPGQVFTVDYEALVSSPHESIGLLLDYCGLQHEQACVEFYRQQRAIATPSAPQVRQPAYTSSVGQWQRFAPYAAGAFERLGSLVDTGKESV